MKNPSVIDDILSNFSSRILRLTLFPTEQCNFRCVYCYEDFLLKKMSTEIRESIKKLITLRAVELDELHLSWFGGEPLLALDTVLNITNHANELVKVHKNYRVKSGMTTNGYLLTPLVFNQLINHNIRQFQISLDGFGVIHDQTRRLANGKGTFEQIWSNLINIRDSKEEVNVTLRVHLTNENFRDINILISNIDNIFKYDPRFQIYIKPVFKMNSSDEFNILEIKKQKSMINLISSNIKNIKCINASTEKYICYASSPNSLSIRSDGNINKCTVALNNECNSIGKIKSNGSIEINNLKLKSWIRGFQNMDYSILGCPLKGIDEIDYGTLELK
ncbi:radical SAM protein [Paenibacillus sp. FSL P4-0338]|uniref:radical SAM protein n=1 Tax=unclassified Paenibacillus TaxID=185978 RepID=UPI0003E2988F|nr:radical SAM protein [Paenibacillus sp. FSL R7-269]ETT51957.1 radical sam domain protein [Paenibacillus sp. FSL R7-269]